MNIYECPLCKKRYKTRFTLSENPYCTGDKVKHSIRVMEELNEPGTPGES